MLVPLSAERAFTKEELDEWRPFLVERLKSQLKQRNISVTGDLAESVVADAIGSNQVDLSFLKYGRFHDMGAKPGWEKGQFVGRETRGERLRPPKGSKFYSSTGWGALSTLMNNLQSRYVARIASDIKKDLTNG